MSHRITLASLLFVPLCSMAAEPKAERPTLSELSLEVMALRTLHEFHLTPQQLTALRKAATSSETSQREEGEGSAKLRQTLTELRAAYQRGDEKRIEALEERLGGQLNAAGTDLDDEVKITPAARRAASRLMQSLSRRQVADFLQSNRDEIPNPQSRLLAALSHTGKLDDEEWSDLVDELKEELSWQLGGLDATKSAQAGERVEAFLNAARTADLKKQRAELEKAARQLTGQVTAAQLQRNFIEHSLAELLSNSRLGAVLKK